MLLHNIFQFQLWLLKLYIKIAQCFCQSFLLFALCPPLTLTIALCPASILIYFYNLKIYLPVSKSIQISLSLRIIRRRGELVPPAHPRLVPRADEAVLVRVPHVHGQGRDLHRHCPGQTPRINQGSLDNSDFIIEYYDLLYSTLFSTVLCTPIYDNECQNSCRLLRKNWTPSCFPIVKMKRSSLYFETFLWWY